MNGKCKCVAPPLDLMASNWIVSSGAPFDSLLPLFGGVPGTGQSSVRLSE